MTRNSLRSLLAACGAFAIGVSLAAQNAPDIPFESNADLLKTPNDVFVGEVGGVGANSKGQIFVYTRTGHPFATLGDNRTFLRGGSRLFVFDKTGKFERELGQDVYGFNAAIGLRVDPQDNVWTIDEAASQVIKFDPNGRVYLVGIRYDQRAATRLAAETRAMQGDACRPLRRASPMPFRPPFWWMATSVTPARTSARTATSKTAFTG
jgi:hypothetical protein